MINITAWDALTNTAVSPERFPEEGEWACFADGRSIVKKKYHTPVEPEPEDKALVERQWRDSELLRTDALIMLPDYPMDLTAYRAALRAYPDAVDFPDGERPTL